MNPYVILDEIAVSSIDDLIEFVESWKIDSHIPLISTWAEENRYIPSGQTELHGLLKHSTAPHLVEIQDACHPDSGIKVVSIMKGSQALVTTAIENAIGHAMRYKLHNILSIISSLKIAAVRSSSAIDVMIDQSNLEDCLKPMSTRMAKKTADGVFYKELHGNRRMMMTSWGSIGDAKSISWSFILMDEIDEAGIELKGQGDPEAIFANRARTIRDAKIIKLGTPTLTTGRIYRNFLEGDQRYYFCQCPFCGEMQVLEMKMGGREYGLTARFDKKKNKLNLIEETVRYICKHCKDKSEIFEYHKGAMLLNGEWRPTAEPVNKEYRSYHVSNLMSPIVFYSWKKVMQDFAETDFGQNILKYKVFVIDILGWPWESRSEKKDWKELRDRVEDYPKKIIPPGGLMITGGADVHKDRIELQVVVWGAYLESWVIDYEVFWGSTKLLDNDVWKQFADFLRTEKYKLRNIDLNISWTAIDSGYNPNDEKEFLRDDNDIVTHHTVYDFVGQTPRTLACRGNPKLKDAIVKEVRVFRDSPLKIRYDVAVNDLKNETFVKTDYAVGKPGGIHFYKGLSDDYFRGFASEVFSEKEPGKWAWNKIFERNEPLDTYILCRAAVEFSGAARKTKEVWAEYENELFRQ